MKLNLLPQTVRTGSKSRGAWVGFVILVLIGMGAAVLMTVNADRADKQSLDDLQAAMPKAQQAFDTSAAADTIIGSPLSKELVLNTNLARAMVAHNFVYPMVYEDVFRYNPPYFRLTSISATPIDAMTSSITMTGTIKTYQQYADLVLALLRNKLVVSVSRSGFNYDELQVPPLVPNDQEGKPRKPGEAPIPDDPLQRLTYFESQPQPAGYVGSGGYGSGTDTEREAMPGESLITIQMVARYPLQTPNPMASLQSVGSATGSAEGAAQGAPPTTAGSPLTPGSTPATPPMAGAAGSRRPPQAGAD